MTQTTLQVIPVTDTNLLQKATLDLNAFAYKYDLDTWRYMDKPTISTNRIFWGIDDAGSVLEKNIYDYLREFFENIFQDIFVILDNKFNGLNASKIFQYNTFGGSEIRDIFKSDTFGNSDIYIKKYQNQIIIDTTIAIYSQGYSSKDSNYCHQVVYCIMEDFNDYFDQRYFSISFRPKWLLVADDNKYRLMVDVKNIDEQLVSLKSQILEQVRKCMRKLLSKQKAKKINQQNKKLNNLMQQLRSTVIDEHKLINNLCNYYHQHQANNDYVKQMTADIHRVHQQAKLYDDNVINYLKKINIDNETIKDILEDCQNAYVIKDDDIINLDKDLQLGVLFSNSSLNDKINNIEKTDEKDYSDDYDNDSNGAAISEFIVSIIRELV